MRILAGLLCLFHTVALVATSGVVLCAGENGHFAYEFGSPVCCEDDDACADEHGGCDEGEGPHVAAGPDCGDCTDTLSPVSSGIHNPLAAIAAPHAEFLSMEPPASTTARPPSSASPDVPTGSRRDVLRC